MAVIEMKLPIPISLNIIKRIRKWVHMVHRLKKSKEVQPNLPRNENQMSLSISLPRKILIKVM